MRIKRLFKYWLQYVFSFHYSRLSYVYSAVQKPDLMANVYNRRQYKIEENTARGNIYDRNGVLLAYSEANGEVQERIYPYGALYSQVIGYSSKVYGKSQIEAAYNNVLLGIDDLSQVFGMVSGSNYPTRKGNNLYLTIDHKLQALGESCLTDEREPWWPWTLKRGKFLLWQAVRILTPREKT